MATIREMTLDDVDVTSVVLARAFRDNPAMAAVIGGDTAHREWALGEFYRALAPTYLDLGESWVLEDEGAVRAAMLTLAPGRYPLPFTADLALLWTTLRKAGLTTVVRFARVDVVMRAQHEKRPHHYLFMIGTDPDWQGRGLGSALLRTLSQRAGPRPCYLETDRLTSVKLYERHGFRVVHEQSVLPGPRAFPLWFMVREGAAPDVT